MKSACLLKQIRLQAGGFFVCAILLSLSSCSNSSGQDNSREKNTIDSTTVTLDNKAATENLHTYAKKAHPDPHDSYVITIRDVLHTGNDWLITFTDSGGRDGWRDGVALLDDHAAVKSADIFNPSDFVPGKGAERIPVHHFFQTIYQEPRLELSYTFYCTGTKGELFLYDLNGKYRKDHQLDAAQPTPIGYRDLPAEYVDTIQVEQYWMIKDGQVVQQ